MTTTKYGYTTLAVGDVVYQPHTPTGPRKATVVKVESWNIGERQDVTIQYDGDPRPYRVWSRSLTPATDYRPADSVAPALYWPANEGDR